MNFRLGTLLIGLSSAFIGFVLKLQCYGAQPAFLFTRILRTCYSDIPALYFARDFNEGIIPYFEVQSDGQFLEYPVLIGIQMYISSIVTNVVQPGSFLLFTYINWAISILLLAIAIWYLDKLNQRAARWFAFSPALLLVLGINWDSIAILFLILGIYSFSKERFLLMGITLGLGMSGKLFPILLLPIALLYLYDKRNFKAMRESVLGALTSWIAMNGLLILFAFDGWIRFFEFSRTRPIDFGSLYYAIRYLFDIETSTALANIIGSVSVGVAFIMVFIYRKRLSFIVAVTLVVSIFVLMNKVYSPQFWLWLAPLFALVISHRWNWIQWNTSQVFYYFAIWAFLAAYTGEPYGISPKVYSLFILLHFVSTLLVIGVVVRHAMRNQPQLEHDPIHP